MLTVSQPQQWAESGPVGFTYQLRKDRMSELPKKPISKRVFAAYPL